MMNRLHPMTQNYKILVVILLWMLRKGGRVMFPLALDLAPRKAMMFAEFRQGNFDLLGGEVRIDYKGWPEISFKA